MIHVQKCYSHETNNTPRSFTTIFSGSEADAIRELWAAEQAAGASGDEYRLVDDDGVLQVILSETECGPMH